MSYVFRTKRWPSQPGYYSRWSGLAAGFLVNAFNLYSYAFGLFSDTLKDDLGFSQSMTDLIASVGELGLWSTFIVGLVLERESPRRVYVIGSAATTLGLGYVALAVGKVIPTNVASMAAMFFLANFGTACFGQTAQATVVRNFPSVDRGKVSGLIKSVFGLSSAVLSVLFSGLFGAEHVDKFLLLLSVGVPALGLVSSVPLNVVPTKHLSYAVERAQGVTPRMAPFYGWFSILTVLLMSAAAVEFFPVTLPVPWTGVFLLAIILSVSVLPFFYGRIFIKDATFIETPSQGTRQANGDVAGESSTDFRLEEDLFGGEVCPLLGSRDTEGVGHNSLTPNDLTWRQCLRDKRFWVLLLSFMCGAGSGLVVINNVTPLADSLEMSSSSFLVTALGISNALGRLTSGWISDYIVGAGLPRSLLFCAMLLMTCGVDFLLAAGMKDLLYPLCVAAGVCYGSMFCLVLALTGDLFGAKHIGTNYGLLDLGPAVGSFVYATGVVNFFYNKTAHGGECIGPRCFGGVFLCTAISCLCASILVFIVLVKPDLKWKRRGAEL